MIIFDIGSCDGEDSIRYSRLFPFAKIFAFEPLPKNFELIEKNILKYKTKNVFPKNIAISDESGESISFNSSEKPDDIKDENLDWDFGNKSNSLLKPSEYMKKNHWLKFNEEIPVKTERLDSFFKNGKISSIDFIHMDVQGAELKVLIGAGEKIKDIKIIWLEVADFELYEGQPLTKDIEQFMKDNNFTIIHSSIIHGVGDQFYVNKKYFKVLPLLKGKIIVNNRFKLTYIRK